MAVRKAQYWFKKFNEGYTGIEFNEIPVRKLILADSDAAILNAVETNSSIGTSKFSDKLGISQTSVIRTLHVHGKVNKCCREFPNELTEKQV